VNDMPERQEWRKSSHSGYNGNCAEVSARGPLVLVRDSRLAASPVLAFGGHAWLRFLAEVAESQ
jgi:Domain of unknown function (DUF397)